MTEELWETYRAKEKAELLLSNLEILKAKLSGVEARYGILTQDYTKMCNDAIVKMIDLKANLENHLESNVGDLSIFKPEMTNLEARFMLGLVPAQTYLKDTQSYDENIIHSARLRVAIDKVADFIELGLNLIGGGVSFLGENMANFFNTIFKVFTPKRRRLEQDGFLDSVTIRQWLDSKS